MDAKTLRQRTADGLKQDLIEATEQLKTLEFKISSNQVKNVRELRLLKQSIARIKTLQKEQENVSL